MMETPAQRAMRLLTRGLTLFESYSTLAEGIARGRLALKTYTRQDFGYDPKRWHDFLAQKKLYSFQSRLKPGIYPDWVLAAVDSPEWLEAVRIAESTLLLERFEQEQNDRRNAIAQAEREWSRKERACPKCETIFKSVGDRGQCPQCGHVFFASHPGDADLWH